VSALDLPAAAGTTALAGAGVFIAGSIFGFVGVLRHRPRQVYGAAAVASGLFLLLVMTIFLPTLARTRSSLSLLEAVPEVGSGRPVIVVAMKLPSLTWYLDQTPEKRELDQVQERMDRDDAVVLVMDRRDIPVLGPGTLHRLREIGSLEKYVVFEEIEQNPNLMPEPGNAPLP
jgi:hypothetical protein